MPDVEGRKGRVPDERNRNKMHIQTNVYFFTISFFSKEDIENAKYISRLFATRHKFYKQTKSAPSK